MGTLWVEVGLMEGRLDVVSLERQAIQVRLDSLQKERDRLVVEVVALRV